MKISSRIFDILQEKSISQKDFAEQTGISPSAISDWKRKGTNPSADKLMSICEALDVSPAYLLTGSEGAGPVQVEYYYNSAQEKELLEIFRCLMPDFKSRLIGYAIALADSQSMSSQVKSSQTRDDLD